MVHRRRRGGRRGAGGLRPAELKPSGNAIERDAGIPWAVQSGVNNGFRGTGEPSSFRRGRRHEGGYVNNLLVA